MKAFLLCPRPSPGAGGGREGEGEGRGPSRRAGPEQRRHHRPPADLVRLEQADHPVLAVVPRVPPDVAGPQPGERLARAARRRPAPPPPGAGAPGCRSPVPDGRRAARRLSPRPGLGADALDLREDLRQRHQAAERRRPRRPAPRPRPVGELLHPVHHPHRQRLAAGRAAPLQAAGLRGLQPHAAGAVAVQVVLPLLGEELDRAADSPPPSPARAGWRSSRGRCRTSRPRAPASAASGRPSC